MIACNCVLRDSFPQFVFVCLLFMLYKMNMDNNFSHTDHRC